MKTLNIAAGLLASLLLSACVTPEETPPAEPAPQETADTNTSSSSADAALETKLTLDNLPPIPRGAGRLVVIRTSIMGFAVQPLIHINDRTIGRCTPGVARVIDLRPGQYDLSGETEVEEAILVPVQPGQTTFVKCSIGAGLVIGRLDFDVVSEATARKNIQSLRVELYD